MGRVLAPDVARQLGSSNPYVRKKAALALIRILKRLPELCDDYVDRIATLLKDRSHGVLITAVQLLADVLRLQPALCHRFARITPSLVKLLRNLLNLGYSLVKPCLV
jgi:AP-1 complex subunit gamma-1